MEYIFTGSEQDPVLVKAENMEQAVMFLAMDSLTEEIVDSFREDNPGASDEEVFAIALKNEIGVVISSYAVERLDSDPVSKENCHLQLSWSKYGSIAKGIVSAGKIN